MTTLCTVWLIVVSIFAYLNLPINALPKIEFPVIVVNASFTGASPETMAQAVALPLEQQFSSIPGLNQVSSTSAQENTQIVLEFDLNADLNAAAQDVATAIASAQSKLPTDMVTTPSFKKINPADQPIVVLSLSSPNMPMWKLNQYCDNYIVPAISMLPDVARVSVSGRQKYAVRIEINPSLFISRKLGLEKIVQDIQNANINVSSGLLQGDTQVRSIFAKSQLKNATEFGDIIISNTPNLRLKDIAKVTDSVDSLYTAAFYGQTRTVILTIHRQPGSNSIAVAHSVKKILPDLKNKLPSNAKLDLIVDRTISTLEGLNEVKITSLLTMILVVLVIYLFFQNLRATLVPAFTLPLCVMLTFTAMYFMGFSLNNMTLLAITLAIGFVIDDAIVVLENITVLREQGIPPLQAAITGAKEISFTVLSMTLSLVAVFIPIVFMEGIIARFLYEFSMTIVMTILISGVVSLTIIPTMSQFQPLVHEQAKNWLVNSFATFYQSMESAYHTSLEAVFKYQKYIIYFLSLIFLVNIILFKIIPKGFLPNEDTGLIYGVTEVSSETSFDEMMRLEKILIQKLSKYDFIESFNASIGTSSSTIASNEGRFFVVLKPIGKRKSIDQIIAMLRADLSKISGLKVSMQAVQNLRIGGMLSKSQYQYTIQAQTSEELQKYTPILHKKIAKNKGFLDVNTDLKLTSIKSNIVIDRELIVRLGIDIKKVTDTLKYAYSDVQISTIYSDLDNYPVIISMDKNDSRKFQDLSKIYISTKQSQLIPLSTIAKFESTNAPLTVNHLNRLPSATISFNLAPNRGLGQAVNEIKLIEKELQLPSTVLTGFQGAAKAFQSSQQSQIYLIIGAILTVYIILGMLYENYRHPITIISGLPSAGIGALFSLMMLRFELDVIAMIGLILLIGIVKKNAIMMIDFALEVQRKDHLPAQEAIILACKRRFRPIMMTTFAAVVGSIPIAIWSGAGAEVRRPLGICIIGGLLVSQWLTLYITPLFYVWIDQLDFKRIKLRLFG